MPSRASRCRLTHPCAVDDGENTCHQRDDEHERQLDDILQRTSTAASTLTTAQCTTEFTQLWHRTSGYVMVVHGRPKTPKNTSFWGSPSPQGSYSPYILEDTTRPGHVTCDLVWSKSDRRRLRKTLHKQTNRQTNRQADTTKIMVTWPWTNHRLRIQYLDV